MVVKRIKVLFSNRTNPKFQILFAWKAFGTECMYIIRSCSEVDAHFVITWNRNFESVKRLIGNNSLVISWRSALIEQALWKASAKACISPASTDGTTGCMLLLELYITCQCDELQRKIMNPICDD